MPSRLASSLLAFVVVAVGGGCPSPGYDLPDGWEDARQTSIYLGPTESGCGAEGEVTVAAALADGKVRLLWDGGVFGCAERHQGFIRNRADGYDLLVQPIDMNPDALAGCVCRSRVRAVLGSGEAGMTVEVFRRRNYEEDPDAEVESIGEATVETDPVDCDGLSPCDTETPCPASDDEDSTLLCVALESCGSVCATAAEACLLDCGKLDCAILESYPEQVSCE